MGSCWGANELRIADWQLPIGWLPIVDCRLLADCRFWDCRLGIADWGLPIGDCRLGIADWDCRIGQSPASPNPRSPNREDQTDVSHVALPIDNRQSNQSAILNPQLANPQLPIANRQ
jgi:hypothetical protein